jgi:excisionase family DNA binding protein
MQEIILSSIPFEQLKSELLGPIKLELQIYFQKLASPIAPVEFLTRKETAQLLGISLVTLNEWQKQGLVQGYRIGSRVRYKRAELESAFAQIKTSRKL